jgi:hypothetical protein
MTGFLLSLFLLLAASGVLAANEAVDRARELEQAGDVREARSVLSRAAEDPAADAEVSLAYAEFLDRYGDPQTKAAYERSLEALRTGGSSASDGLLKVYRRLVQLSLLAGDTGGARRYLSSYRAAGGTGMEQAEGASQPQPQEGTADGYAKIPGPLFSFRRMAALSSDQSFEELVPALARNVVISGYRAGAGGESLSQTEYLKLILQYLSQARELEQLGGGDHTIRVPECESRETSQLLKILGFRLRNECGPEAVLETVNPSRAFLSIDSGFPLADLEQAFREQRPFELAYRPTLLPVKFGPDYWFGVAEKKVEGDFIETLLRSPAMARLYVALSKMHAPTALAMKEQIAGDRLRDYAGVIDFFGGMFEIKDGRVVLPGGSRTQAVWEKLVGVSTDRGAAFFQRLVEKDDGWMASYYDSVARVGGVAADYFYEPRRLERFYMAVRGKVTSPGPARPVFRSNSDLMLLTARVHFNADGSPHIPGGVEVWKRLFIEHPHGEYDGMLTESAAAWTEPDDVMEAMFGLCRKMVENEPLHMFLAISNLDRRRSTPLPPSAVERITIAYPGHGDQLSLFNDAPMLSAETVVRYLDLMDRIDEIGNDVRRTDAAGMVQSLVGLWQIFLRQGQIPEAEAERAFLALIEPFHQAESHQELFEAGRGGVQALLSATGSDPDASPQDRLMALLAGEPREGEKAVHTEVGKILNTRFTAQRLVSIKDIFDLADHLERVSRGETFNVAMANRLAARISEVRLPRSSLSSEEANVFSPGKAVEAHIQQQRSLNLSREVDKAGGRSGDLLEIRGELAPILRDSLVGLNYIYYSPPGAELIRANPLFVRSHDFLGRQEADTWRQPRLKGTGWPNNGGGRLTGSLNGLAFALAEAEQNFLVPSERQALIWQDLAPQILLGATVPRWWGLGAADQHFVSLHLKLGGQILAAATLDDGDWNAVEALLRKQVEPARIWRIRKLLTGGRVQVGLEQLTPSEIYHLAASFAEAHPDRLQAIGGPFWPEIQRLTAAEPERFSYQRAALLFGTPHPELARSYRSELLRLPLFPTMMRYSSRIMAESWESTNLYWAQLADELHLPPAQLNLLVPEWTQRSLERIFATNLDHWPALLRSMRLVGQRYREQLRPRLAPAVQASRE